MKTVFAGPSIYGVAIDVTGIDLRPPAAQGDLLRAVLDGANVIGLVDGAFEAAAAVWHKEILHALSEGIAVIGGASMGALRAAECAAFGMEPVGRIAQAYLDGKTDDDALVAITHGPPELGSPPLTEALVDCEATIAEMLRRRLLSPEAARQAVRLAREMYYKERTVEALGRIAAPQDPEQFAASYLRCRVSIKTEDAIAVIDRVRSLPDTRRRRQREWQLNQPPLWREALRTALST